MENESLSIVPAEIQDIPELKQVFTAAKQIMQSTNNPNQWSVNYPSEEVLLEDIKSKSLYKILDLQNKICAVFAFIIGKEPTYEIIEDGNWLNDKDYGTIHRLASNGNYKGIFHKVFKFCKTLAQEIRVDTHEDNKIMQKLLFLHGFFKCGTIFLKDGSPRLAYQYVNFESQKNLNIAFCSSNIALADFFVRNLKNEFYNIQSYNSITKAFSDIRNDSFIPDLVIADYLILNHDLNNVFFETEKYSKTCPLLFFNDPVITTGNYVSHWEGILTLTFRVPDHEMPYFHKFLTDLRFLILNPTIRPFIPLLKRPNRFPISFYNEESPEYNFAKTQWDTLTAEFPENLKTLLQIFQENPENPISVERIMEIYEERGSSIQETSLKVNISKLRSLLAESSNWNAVIASKGKDYIYLEY